MSRRRRWAWLSVACTTVLAVGCGVSAAEDENSLPTAQLGSDTFDGPAGAPPDPRMWTYDLGGGGWGNHETQRYKDSQENVRLDGNGNLLLEARATPSGYTSARVVTRDRFEFTHGTLSARIKFPAGKGIHSAFWLLGENIAQVGYPESGEIDVMEAVGDMRESHNAIHGPWQGPPKHGDSKWKLSFDGRLGFDVTEGFHTYTVTRSPDLIVIAIDGIEVGRYTPAQMPPGAEWVFDRPFYLIFNVAVGGDWPGPTDRTSPDVATMAVDFVQFTPQED